MNASFWNIKILANNNSILENRFNNSYSALSLTAAHGNSIENNTITDEYIGISLYESTQNEIAANFAFNCSQKTLALESHSTNNIVTLNTFSSSYQGAIEDANSGNNTFYHNSFINNHFKCHSPEAKTDGIAVIQPAETTGATATALTFTVAHTRISLAAMG